jgi:hypothetical protein
MVTLKQNWTNNITTDDLRRYLEEDHDCKIDFISKSNNYVAIFATDNTVASLLMKPSGIIETISEVQPMKALETKS